MNENIFNTQQLRLKKETFDSFLLHPKKSSNFPFHTDEWTSLEIEEYFSLVSQAPFQVFFLDEQKRLLHSTPQIKKHSQKNSHKMLEKKFQQIFLLSSHKDDQNNIWKTVEETGRWQGSFNYRDENQQHKRCWLTILSFKNNLYHQATYGVLLLDNQHQCFSEFEKNILSYSDPVTKLPNFHQAALDLNLLGQSPLSLCGISLIRCSNICEISVLHSSDIKRVVTLEMATRIEISLPPSYKLYRLSRDIFAVFCSNLQSESEFIQVLIQIRNSLLKPIKISQKKTLLNLEIGVSYYPTRSNNLSNMLQTAEISLNQHDITRIVLYEKEMDAQYTNDLRILERLQQAIEGNYLEIHYQPIYNRDQILVAAEALLRWNDPVLGNIPPNTIINAAHKHGVTSKLTQWILHQIFEDALYLEIDIHINIDVTQTIHPRFLQEIENLQQTYPKLKPSKIIFEITEHQAFEQSEAALAVLFKLKELGFSLAIDDFGIGHTALTLLHDLPADILKIDKYFVTNIADCSKKKIITQHIIHLAKSLNLKICCEGIETLKDQSLAQKMESDFFQGYFYSRPVSLTHFKSFLTQKTYIGCVCENTFD